MIFSVWNPDTKLFTYYESPVRKGDGMPAMPKHLPRDRNGIGVAPEDAAWNLPGNAVRIGEGMQAKGTIARVGGAPLGEWNVGEGIQLAAAVVGGLVLLRAFR